MAATARLSRHVYWQAACCRGVRPQRGQKGAVEGQQVDERLREVASRRDGMAGVCHLNNKPLDTNEFSCKTQHL